MKSCPFGSENTVFYRDLKFLFCHFYPPLGFIISYQRTNENRDLALRFTCSLRLTNKIVPVILIPCYQKAKKLLEGWDGENEEISDAIESQVSFIIWLSNAALIISYFLIAACYSKGFATFESSSKTTLLFIGIAAFVGIIPETIILQQKSVDIVKKMNPEKTASVYDMKFQKKWMDSCDEAEKLMIGKCAFKAYRSTNMSCGILAIILACSALVFDIGFLPSFCVCLIWIINHTSYCREAARLAKMGNKIS